MSRARRVLEIALCAVILVGANLLAARHVRRWDLTRTQVFALSERTIELLKAAPGKVKLLVFLVPRGEDKSLLYPYVREFCDRVAAVSDRVTVEFPDLDREPERIRQLGAHYGISGADLADGAIVVDVEGRSKNLLQKDLAELDWGSATGPKLRAFTAERALAGALLELADPKPKQLCVTHGQGEPDIDAYEVGGAAELKDVLAHDHYAVKKLLDGALPDASCDVVVVLGPTETLAAPLVEAVAKHLEAGKPLLALIGPTLDAKTLTWKTLGIEPLLAAWGAELPRAVLIDEPHAPQNPLAFVVTDGYRDHAIVRGLIGRRTIWTAMRPIAKRERPEMRVTPLVVSSERGFGETKLDFITQGEAAMHFDEGTDLAGPLPLGLAIERTGGTGKGARLVVWGGVEQVLNRQLTTAHRDLILSSLGWLIASDARVNVGARAVERYELRLTDGDRYRVFGIAVLGMPVLALLFAAAIAWLRRS